MPSKVELIIGSVYGKLTILSEAGKSKSGGIMWTCKCSCGVIKDIQGSSIARGNTMSCGCLLAETAKKTHTKHGKSYTREYIIWDGMRQRCYNPAAEHYIHYGGRGISVCERWNNSFADFYADMGSSPHGYSIERIDVDGNYCPENCKWENSANQAFNTRKRRTNTSGRTGVDWLKNRMKWRASIGVQGKNLHLGVFDNFEDAVSARVAAEIQFYGSVKK